MTNATTNPEDIEIRKPTTGGFTTTNNFGNNYCSAESSARTYREVYINGKLVGDMSKDDGLWEIAVETPECQQIQLFTKSIRSAITVKRQIADAIREQTTGD